MEPLKDEQFIRKVENLIDPDEYSFIYFIQKLKRLLPRRLFKTLLLNASRKTPRIGFVIEPYSLFLFFKIKNIELAESMLHDRYQLVKSKIFEDGEPGYYMGYGALNTRASTFWGIRLESYLIARDRETGLFSWIFIDIISSTLIALPAEGVADPNSGEALFTTNAKGEIFLDIEEKGTKRGLSLKGTLERGRRRMLEEDLWLLGNTSIAHSKNLMDGSDEPFAVIFDAAEVESALEIPAGDIELRSNTLFPGLAETEIGMALCFPFAQHYIADSPGCRTIIKDKKDMGEEYDSVAFGEPLSTYSTKGIKRLFALGLIISLVAFLLAVIL